MNLLICGPVHPTELAYFPAGLEVTVLGFPGQLTRREFRHAVKRAKPDVALFQFYGNEVRNAQKIGVHKLACPKAAWFLDTHVAFCRKQELEAAEMFDAIFLTHSRFVQEFSAHPNCQWMPASLYAMEGQHDRFAYPCLAQGPPLAPTSFRHDVSLLCGDWGRIEPKVPSRAEVLATLTPHLDRAGIGYFFGEDRESGFDRMRHSRVCLNLCNANDFNIRNFEILALGRPLVTDRTTDHDKIPGLNEHCHFYDPARPETLVELLRDMDGLYDPDRARAGFEFVRSAHTNLHRLLHMLNVLTGTAYSLRPQ